MTKDLITNDDRPIASLVIDSNQRVQEQIITVGGQSAVTKIEAYNEFGEHDCVIWFAIYIGDQLVRRVSGKYVVEIGYGE